MQTLNVGKIRKYDGKKFAFEERTFPSLMLSFNQIGKTQNMPVVAGYRVYL